MAESTNVKTTPAGAERIRRLHEKYGKKFNREKMIIYFRHVLHLEGSVEKYWGWMLESKPIPKRFLEAVRGYLLMIGHDSFEVQEVASDTDEPLDTIAPDPWLNMWEKVSSRIRGVVQSAVGLRDEAECKGLCDIKAMVAKVLPDVGRRLCKSANREDWKASGEREMRRNEKEYVDYLYHLWLKQPDCIRLALHKGRRIGYSNIFSVTNNAYERLRAGELFDMDITPDDLQEGSSYFYFSFVIEFPDQKTPRKVAEKASALCLASQIALLARNPLGDSDINCIGIGGCEEGVHKYRGAGFVEVGKRMPVVGKELFELNDRAAKASAVAAKSYKKMRRAIKVIQFFINLGS